jgi:hypothetical protein
VLNTLTPNTLKNILPGSALGICKLFTFHICLFQILISVNFRCNSRTLTMINYVVDNGEISFNYQNMSISCILLKRFIHFLLLTRKKTRKEGVMLDRCQCQSYNEININGQRFQLYVNTQNAILGS